jgi:virulence-associated protein VapD
LVPLEGLNHQIAKHVGFAPLNGWVYVGNALVNAASVYQATDEEFTKRLEYFGKSPGE